MPQTRDTNRRIVLAQRPVGEPDDGTLRLETGPVPQAGTGEALLRTEWLSLDPYMRGRMNDAKSYATPVGIGEVMTGQVVAEVVESDVDRLRVGDRVLAMSGWQDWAVTDGTGVTPLPRDMERPSWALGLLGMPGLTAHAGLTRIAAPKPGETLVVGAATGPVGATVGQIAKIMGCRVVGVAGGAKKCAHAVDLLGFDACLDHRSETFEADLAAACPDGVDIYWENVGARVLYAVLPLLNPFARVPVCGVAGWYNLARLPDGPDRGPQIMSTVLRMKVRMEGFIVYDSFPPEAYGAFEADMTRWVAEGRIAYREQVVEGLEAAPAALRDLLAGRGFGKMVVRLG
ncbi:NADP-dependent oxidoreductase [Jannaschia sp. Os4]|uniref:NADP-dependent oxidoreductase n=1 Tax=Jannaschia sp. Os4 TaxID=2807617 RepID=UPI00193A8DEB|nr:NADP-dependent oxidoreductase [Jannaschia sp. Os4]MBM2576839.1 NADP-dependent oxidoreductase [Jannaschia sp. Os4]